MNLGRMEEVVSSLAWQSLTTPQRKVYDTRIDIFFPFPLTDGVRPPNFRSPNKRIPGKRAFRVREYVYRSVMRGKLHIIPTPELLLLHADVRFD